MNSLQRWFCYASAVAVSGAVIAWTLYVAIGRHLFEMLYYSTSLPFVDGLLPGRSDTPLAEYHRSANILFLDLTGRMVRLVLAGTVTLLVVRRPLSTASAGICILVFSVSAVALVETKPTLIVKLRLDSIPYFRSNLYKVGDPDLGFRGRANLNFRTRRPHGNDYRLYGLAAPSGEVEWVSNEHGFRGIGGNADVVVIGDSFIDHGWTDDDTFGKRLERHLSGRSVTNLAVAGYSPHQYLEVLKRYGVPKRPEYALFSFYAGNDYWQINDFLKWKELGTPLYAYTTGSKPFYLRYVLAMTGIVHYVRASIWIRSLCLINNMTLDPNTVHPDVAVLDLGDRTHMIRFVDKQLPLTSKEISTTTEWRELTRILAEFKEVSEKNGIKPYLLYIPMGVTIYGEYSTKGSGQGWLGIRERQIALKSNFEKAIKNLAQDLRVELLNLTDPFSAAATEGQMLYEPIDDHWNSRGREIAARYVAERLHLSRQPSDSRSRSGMPPRPESVGEIVFQ